VIRPRQVTVRRVRQGISRAVWWRDGGKHSCRGRVRRNIQRASNYVLGVVLFAVALFFAGMSTTVEARGLRWATVAVGSAVFVATVGWIATFPVSLTV
jgi:hypothetical protein